MAAEYFHLNRLPPEMLLKIFVRLPVKCLVTNVPLVSQSWYRLAQIARTQTHSLIVLVNEDALKQARKLCNTYQGYINDPDVAAIETRLQYIVNKGLVIQGEPSAFSSGSKFYPPLSIVQGDWLVAHFSHITHLEFIEPFSCPDSRVIHSILEQLCTQLYSIKLLVDFCPIDKSNARLQQLTSLLTPERFLRLKHFSLNSARIFNFFSKPKLSLPILAQLETFHLISFDKSYMLARSLCKYAGPVNHTLHSIKLDSSSFWLEEFVQVLKNECGADETTLKAIGARFTHISDGSFHWITEESARLLAKYFMNITFLCFKPEHAQQPINAIFSSLAQLTHLKTLKILLYFGTGVVIEEFRPSVHTNFLTPLSSVTKLILCNDNIDIYRTNQISSNLPRHSLVEEQLRPSVLLPNLETVYCVQKLGYWWFSGCDKCGYDDEANIKTSNLSSKDFTQVRMFCLAALLAPFEACKQLRNKAFLVAREEHRFRVPGWECMVHPLYDYEQH